jgi:tetratricopeptide (TPR) repeat protein
MKNKINMITMNKFKIFSVAFLASVSFSNAQDITQAGKAIDAEQYEKAKSMLKTILKSNPTDGKANFLLGNIYLIQTETDSAKIAYQNGLTGKDDAKLNYIGLGTIDLDNKNTTAAEANFALALKGTRKKDVEELTAIGRAYTNSDNPNFSKAVEVLNKAKEINPNDANVQLALGDAYNFDKNQNDAYVAYRNAFQFDPTLLRAKMQLGVLLKGAKSYDEAIKSFNEVIAINPNYGPVYRELAETYYKWGMNKPSKYDEYMQTAIGFYEKYINLTDQSIHSRMRHADFLILVKDYKALEVEANKMIELDKVNPRIFRYLGYSAYENGNTDLAIKSLEDFIANPINKVIAKDYLYLAEAKFKKGLAADESTIDSTLYVSGISDIKKAIEIQPLIIEDFNAVGKKLFNLKLYKYAADIFEFGTTNAEFKNYLDDNIYYGISVYYANIQKDVVVDKAALLKADNAFVNVAKASPTYQDAYFYRARINALVENNELMKKNYEDYMASATEKGAEELAKPAVIKRFVEAYNNIATIYLKTDKATAISYIDKALLIDPADPRALELKAYLK